ncbi:MAG: 50S ribosomal protein L15 [Candidatus Margulisbacteria bacterium]|nr:50S ribosomal protein L15 [Candidatus Margulisiibacteriota bacterium]
MGILSELKTYIGSQTKRKRVGRGESSGLGKTSGKGNKGQQSRSGGGTRPGFEGGQMPLYKKVPKLKGFKALTKKDYEIVNLSTISNLKLKKVDITVLKEKGIINNRTKRLKVLAQGELKEAVTIKADIFSKKAVELIEKVGGKAEVVNG